MDNPPLVAFKPCRVVEKNNKTYFIWPLTDEVKSKIRKHLNAPDLEFGFNNTLEETPPFFCPECGTEITFFDQVREGLVNGPHTPEQLAELLERKELVGTGAIHRLTCEEGHKQPILTGWAANFGWTYEFPNLLDATTD